MIKSKFRIILSMFCCMCFISNFICDLTGEIAKADTTNCQINVTGYTSVDGSEYKYEENGNSCGALSVFSQSSENDEPKACTPNGDGIITDISKGSTVIFVFEPESGFTPNLKINNQSVDLAELGENQYVGSLVNLQAAQTNVEAGFSHQTTENGKNIVVNLKCIEEDQPQSGTYNDDFKTKWSVIEYSTDDGNTYLPLDQGTTAGENGSYTFDESIDSVKLKLTCAQKVIASVDGELAESGETITLERGSHLVMFQESVYTVVWLYSDEGIDDKSAITKHGKVSIEKDGEIDGQENNIGGVYAVTPGTKVTMHFEPDYGYQFKKSVISDNVEVTPDNDECTYTFTMPEDDVVIGDIFTESSDVINIDIDSIVSANILNASEIITSGNIELDINDALLTEETKNKINNAASKKDLTPITYFNIELNSFLSKGASGENWETMIPQTGSPAKITLTLADDLKGGDSYSVVRMDGNEVTFLDTKYNESEGTLQFETDRFSQQYAVCANSSSSAVTSARKVITGDNNKLLLYSLIAIAAVLVIIYTFKSSKKNKYKM